MLRPDTSKPLGRGQASRLFVHEFCAVLLWSTAAHAVFFLCMSPLLHSHIPSLADQSPLSVFSAGVAGLLALWDAGGLWLGSPVNPTMTLTLLLAGRVSAGAAATIAAAQFGANLAAAATARSVAHYVAAEHMESVFSPPVPKPHVGFVLGVVFECVVTALFCAVMLSLDDLVGKEDAVRRYAVSTGLFLALMQVGAEWTGSVMNPGLTLALAMLTGKWQQQAVYWVGPGLGAALAATVVRAHERRKARNDDEVARVTRLSEGSEADKKEGEEETASATTSTATEEDSEPKKEK